MCGNDGGGLHKMDVAHVALRINVALGQREERRLITGHHVVADIHCKVCDSVLGWKYVRVPVTAYLPYLLVCGSAGLRGCRGDTRRVRHCMFPPVLLTDTETFRTFVSAGGSLRGVTEIQGEHLSSGTSHILPPRQPDI